MKFLKPYSPFLLSALRIMSGLLLLQHGTTKYLSFPETQMSGASPASMSGAAGLIELVGGLLIVAGLFTRPVSFIVSGMLAVAYFYCFVFLYLAAAGAGPLSIDRILKRD